MSASTTDMSLPVVVIGAGPVGLAEAAHLLARGQTPLVLEAGNAVGASIRQWSHVRFFSPWKYTVDAASVALLEPAGWTVPDPERAPTGNDIVERYLEPLAALPQVAPHIRLGTRVTAITRLGHDKMKTSGREDAPFVVRIQSAASGDEEPVLARAVIDASGTWSMPNPLGADGLPALGESAAAEHVFYGIPDVLGGHCARYAGKRIAVVGSGHSAFNALLELATLASLADQAPSTEVTWVVRRAQVGELFGGEHNDALPERGRLGSRTRALVESEVVRLISMRIAEVRRTDDGLLLVGEAVGPRRAAPRGRRAPGTRMDRRSHSRGGASRGRRASRCCPGPTARSPHRNPLRSWPARRHRVVGARASRSSQPCGHHRGHRRLAECRWTGPAGHTERTPTHPCVSSRPADRVRLGLGANWQQFTLLVVINAFVGGMVGLERAALPLLAEHDFLLT